MKYCYFGKSLKIHHGENMKNLLLVLFSCLILVSCSDDEVQPEPEVNFEPTGFTLTYNDSIYTEYQNGEYMSDADTIRMDWFEGEKTFDINFMDKDGNFYENVDPLDYVTFAKVTNRSEIEDPIVHGSAFNFILSLTPHDEGVTDFLLQVTREEDGEIVFKADSLFIEIY